MKVLNIHKRIIKQPKEKVIALIETLATKEDKIWPRELWPRMKLSEGLQEGSKGGHGPIRYWISKYRPGNLIQFEFTKPQGYHGHHRFEIVELTKHQTELKHIIDIRAKGMGILTWTFAIRWLHDALIEDAFDKVENHFQAEKKKTTWNLWVKILRGILK